MDYDRDLHAVQQVLLRWTYVSQELKDKERLQMLSEQIKGVLNNTDDCNHKNIFLFMLLNSDADYVDIVAEDENFSHLVDTAPRLDHSLILRVVLRLRGILFLQELVAFGPPTISLSVMKTLCHINDIVREPVFAITEMANACFHRLYLSSSENLEFAFNFLQFFKQCLSVNFEWIRSISECEWKACRIIHHLSICAFCMKEKLVDKTDSWNGFVIKCSLNEIDKVSINSSKIHSVQDMIVECRNLIIENCIGILREITFLDWINMVDLKSECSQEKIIKLAFQTKQVLEKFEKHEDVIELLQMMEFCGVAHREEENEISLPIEEVKLMLLDDATKSQKWMKMFLNFSCTLLDCENIDIIDTNYKLLDDEDVELLLEKIYTLLHSGNVCDVVLDPLKCLFYKVMKILPLEKLVDVHKYFMEKDGLSASLRCANFKALLRSAFNRTTFKNEESTNEVPQQVLLKGFIKLRKNQRPVSMINFIDQRTTYGLWQHEYIALSMMDFVEFSREALLMALENHDLACQVSKVFHLLSPVSEKVVPDLIYQMSSNLTCANKIDKFAALVQQLVQQQVICADMFFKRYISSAIEQSISSSDWSSICVWIKTIGIILPNLYPTGKICNNAVVFIVYLVQIIEHSQQQIDKFSVKCVQAREGTIALLEHLRKLDLSEPALKWLKSYDFGFSPLTKCYVQELFCTKMTDHKFAAAYELCFNAHQKTPETAALILLEMLPSLSSYEWKSIAVVLKQLFAQHDDPAYSTFQSFNQAVLLLSSACCNIDQPICSNRLLCLHYCLSCFANILKLHVLTDLLRKNFLKVLEESLYLLSQLPAEVLNRGGMDVLPELMNLIEQVPLDLDNFNTFSFIISEFPTNECSVLLAEKLRTVFQGKAMPNEEDMEKARPRDIPKDAVVLNRDEAFSYLTNLVFSHKPQSEILLLKYGGFASGLLAAIMGVGTLKFFRRAFGLRKEVEISSCFATAFVPGTSVFVYQFLFIYPPILLEEATCPVCLQLKAAALQFFGGVCVPFILGLVTASMTATRLGSNMPKPSEPLKLLELGLKLANHPTGRYKLLGMTVISIFGTMCLVQGQQMQVITLKKRLIARREMADD
ncbi:Transmembrane protein 126A [Frankliniella fusca]|uniref:Transmembrane protein 126A n=1 Tax=Frankliniella fusca TaxID=407009 RepID=A0AAE1GTN8_9NEOP|nr:Transmembrane protein 126A [Frankliniella fusca]